jgi:hypothetical protein
MTVYDMAGKFKDQCGNRFERKYCHSAGSRDSSKKYELVPHYDQGRSLTQDQIRCTLPTRSVIQNTENI